MEYSFRNLNYALNCKEALDKLIKHPPEDCSPDAAWIAGNLFPLIDNEERRYMAKWLLDNSK